MDELALFFSDDPGLTGDCSPRTGILTTDQPKIQVSASMQNRLQVLRNSSFPSVRAHSPIRSLPTSGSFPMASSLPQDLPPEPEDGNIEYKLKLINPTQDRLEHLMTQMKWRLNEGGGQAIYRLGVDDNGEVTGLTASEMSSSIFSIFNMAQRLDVNLRLLRECTVSKAIPTSKLSPIELANPSLRLQRKAVELLAKWKTSVNEGAPDLRVAMLGSVAVGKSTLLGILTDGELDNGRGRARLNLFRHLHEVQSGRTSSLSSELIGFDSTGHLINRRRFQGRLNKRSIDEVVRDSHRLMTFLDLAGHAKYQGTTLSGLIAHRPAFCLLVVSATTGLTPEGLCHARLATALGLPLAVVLSKVDHLLGGATASTLERKLSVATAAAEAVSSRTTTTTAGGTVSSAAGNAAIAELTRTVLDKLRSIRCYSLGRRGRLRSIECFKGGTPVFPVSSVSGYGLGDLLRCLSVISCSEGSGDSGDSGGLLVPSLAAAAASSTSTDTGDNSHFVECWITKVFSQVPGVGAPVLEVLVKSGQVHENQALWMGPDEEGHFHLIRVIELRHHRHPHRVLHCGQLGSLVAVAAEPDANSAESSFFQSPPRRGMVLTSAEPQASPCLPVAPSIGVAWGLSISQLVWLPGGGAKTRRGCPQPNTTVCVHTGNVCQYAKVIEISLHCEQLDRLIKRVGDAGASASALLRLNPLHKIVVAFLRQPEFLELGRQVIISVSKVAQAAGIVEGFNNLVTTFSPLPSDDLSASSSYLSSSWQHATMGPPEPTSGEPSGATFEDLLRQIGIDPERTTTTFVDEPPLPGELQASKDITDLTQRNRHRQRRNKRKFV